MRNKTNIKSEANWSVFRRDFTPGFESVLDLGVNNGWYDVNHALEKYVNGYCNESWISFTFSFSLVFRWLAIPWLQAEVDRWLIQRNRTAPRADRNKILPHGIPTLIREKPHLYNAVDFKVPALTPM